jgi:hypothetical protein
MRIDEAVSVVGSKAELQRQLGLKSQSSISNWEREGKQLLPELYARRLDGYRKGRKRLRFDPKAYGLAS